MFCVISTNLGCATSVPTPLAAEAVLAMDKFTSSQPFSAEVIGLQRSWSGFIIYLQSSDDPSKRCVATIYTGRPVDYRLIAEEPAMHVRFDPPIPVSDFNYETNLYSIGPKYGKPSKLRFKLSSHITSGGN